MVEEAQPLSSGSPAVEFQVTRAGKFCGGHRHAVNHPTILLSQTGRKLGFALSTLLSLMQEQHSQASPHWEGRHHPCLSKAPTKAQNQKHHR